MPENVSNYFYPVKVDGYISGYAGIPSIQVTNRMNGRGPTSGGSGGGSGQDANGDGPKYRLVSSVPIDFGRNEIEVSLTEDWRILFYKQFPVDLTMERVEPIIDYSKLSYGFGDYTVLKSVTPEQAYINSTSNDFEITAVVGSKHGNGLTFTIEVQDGDQYRKVSEVNVPFDKDTFDTKLTLPKEPGLYRVTAVSLVTNPRYSSTTAVAKWYVNKGE